MRLRLPLALILASASLAAPALAQPKPDAAKPDKPDAGKPDPGKAGPKDPKDPKEIREETNRMLAKQAEARLAEQVKRGIEACDRGEFDDGLAALTSAWSRKNDADIGGALGLCEMKAAQWPSAADHLAAALRLKEEGPDRKKLEEAYLEARKHVGVVQLTVNVEGADVFLGSRFVGQTPLPGEVFVEPGKRTPVLVKKTGYDEAQSSVEVAAQRAVAVKLELVPTPSGGNRYASAERSKTPFFVLGGAGLIAGGVGAALYAAAVTNGAAADDLLAEIKSAHASQGSPCQPSNTGCSTVASLRASRDKLMNIGTGALIGSGVLLGAAVLTGVWAFSGGSPSSSGRSAPSGGSGVASVTVVPVASPDGAGIWLRGAF